MSISIFDKVILRAKEIQQIPAPTLEEEKRAKYVYHQFLQEKLLDVEIDEDFNVYGRIAGEGKQPPIILSAHLDTVFSSEVNLSIREENNLIYGPGIGDNSLALAGLFGIIWKIREEHIKLPGDLWLVANVGEEGLGDLKGMRKVTNRFGNLPNAYIVLEGMAYGVVFHSGIGVKRYRIIFTAKGGHSWIHYGEISAIHEAAEFISKLSKLKLDDNPKTTLNVGVISGGTSINSIASQAVFELDLRSESEVMVNQLAEKVLQMGKEYTKPGLSIDFEPVGDRPAGEIPSSHPLVKIAVASLANQGRTANLIKASTDANIPLSLGYSSICIGIGNGGDAHTIEEFIQIDNIEKGIDHVLEVITKAFTMSID